MPAAKITRLTQACNHIVDFTLAGRHSEIDRNARSLFLRSYRGVEWHDHPDGILVPFHSMPKPTAEILYSMAPEAAAYLEIAASVLAPDRFEAIVEDDAEPSPDDCMRFQLAYIEAIVAHRLSADPDDCPAYFIRSVGHADGRNVFALLSLSGYSFTGLRRKFHGFFATREDVVAHLESIGLPLPEAA